MSIHSRLRIDPRLLVTVCWVLVTGCRCDRQQTGNGAGEVRLVYDDHGVTVAQNDGVYDFGTISMGKTATLELTVQNSGRASVSLESISQESGAPVSVGQQVAEPDAIFTLDFEPTTVPAGETRTFALTFQPPIETATTSTDYQSVLSLRSSPTEVGREVARITLIGKAVSGECELPSSLDFGAIARGSTSSLQVVFANERPIDTVALIGAVESEHGAAFELSADSPHGAFGVPAHRARTATFTFAPTEVAEYFAVVTMRAAEGCPDRRVRLIGSGVDQVLTWAPAAVDYGSVSPMVSKTNSLAFSNLGFEPVTLSTLSVLEGTSPSANFSVASQTLLVPGASRDAHNAIVAGHASLELTFKPVLLGAHAGFVRAATSLHTQAMIAVPVRGAGGGPDIVVKPISFGHLAWFSQAAVPSFATRTLTVQNVGSRPNPSDLQANLHLGREGIGGMGRYFSIVAKNDNTRASELCVGRYDESGVGCTNDLPTSGAGRYDPIIGLEATATGSVLDISVRITPDSLGDKAWELTVYSNDPDEPAVTVPIVATVIDTPPCSVSVTTQTLNFGVVSPPSTRDLGFVIRNTSSQSCLLTNLQVLPETGTPTGMPPIFSLPQGEIVERLLAPGETLQVLARAWPQGVLPAIASAVSGKVQFNVASPTMPLMTVTLAATIGTTCLTISPGDLDFGTVGLGCNSAELPFFIYNTCTQPVTLSSGQLVGAAGQNGGDPACAGPGPCPEFVVTSPVAPGTVVNAGTSVPPSFRIKYRPIDLGADTGWFVLHVLQAGVPTDYVVTLRGAGDTAGLNVDTFRQAVRPKADILLVIDDSGSMADKQLQLGQNLNAFLQYARASRVDFNLAVTNTEMSDPTLGDFRSSPGGFKVLTPETPNLAREFAGLVQVGLTGGTESCLEGARRALTAPKIVGANTGFLRPEAFLAVVCVSDAGDQGAFDTATYLNQFLAIKGLQQASKFSFSDIGPYLTTQPANCGYDEDRDVSSYLSMVSRTHGVKEEICTPDWATALQNVGKSAFGFRTSFYLTAPPDLLSPRGLEVGIDARACSVSVPCPQNQVCSTVSNTCTIPKLIGDAPVWHYSSATNSIDFEPLYVPEPGRTLTVAYQVMCHL